MLSKQHQLNWAKLLWDIAIERTNSTWSPQISLSPLLLHHHHNRFHHNSNNNKNNNNQPCFFFYFTSNCIPLFMPLLYPLQIWNITLLLEQCYFIFCCVPRNLLFIISKKGLFYKFKCFFSYLKSSHIGVKQPLVTCRRTNYRAFSTAISFSLRGLFILFVNS